MLPVAEQVLLQQHQHPFYTPHLSQRQQILLHEPATHLLGGVMERIDTQLALDTLPLEASLAM
jgi:hypothetical protein